MVVLRNVVRYRIHAEQVHDREQGNRKAVSIHILHPGGVNALLEHGGVLRLTDGGEITVIAAPEPLLQVTATHLPRIAWHIGNRHTPCQIEDTRLLIQRDHVIKEMLELLGATVTEVTEPFTPEGGAYGHGRTHSHDHSHPHAHDHTMDHGHSHSHDHDH